MDLHKLGFVQAMEAKKLRAGGEGIFSLFLFLKPAYLWSIRAPRVKRSLDLGLPHIMPSAERLPMWRMAKRKAGSRGRDKCSQKGSKPEQGHYSSQMYKRTGALSHWHVKGCLRLGCAGGGLVEAAGVEEVPHFHTGSTYCVLQGVCLSGEERGPT